MLLAWVVYPALLLIASLGLGLLVERAAGVSIPASLLPPTGMAALMVVGVLQISWAPAARYTLLTVIVLVIAGFLVRRRSVPLRARIGGDRWAIGAILLVFLVYAAPVLVSGTPTFTGWIRLDDGASWLALADRIVTAGRTSAGMPPSSSEALLATVFAANYPVGSFVPLGLGAQALHVDSAELLQPVITVYAAMTGLALLAVLRSALTGMAFLRAATVTIATQATLLYGYAIWGGVKELALALLIPTVAAWVFIGPDPIPPASPGELTPPEPAASADTEPAGLLANSTEPATAASPATAAAAASQRKAHRRQTLRATLGLAVVGAAVVGVGGVNGALWLVIPALAWLVLIVRRLGVAGAALVAAAGIVATAVLAGGEVIRTSLSYIASMGRFASGGDDLGTLWGKLRSEQVVGIWPIGDFRAVPARMDLTWVLIILVIVLATIGCIWCWRRRQLEPLLYLVTAVPLAFLLSRGGAWIGGKAMAISSPALLAVAGAGLALLVAHRRMTEAVVAGGVVSVGVLAGSWATYKEAPLAPYGDNAELARIGASGPQAAPALITDYSPYGARHYLSALAGQGAGELRRDVIPLRQDPGGLGKTGVADIDDFEPRAIYPFKTLVLRRTVTASRPPSNYQLVWQGANYQQWQRDDSRPTPIEHVGLGDLNNPQATPPCEVVKGLGATAQKLGPAVQLAYSERPGQIELSLATGQMPNSWGRDTNSGQVWPNTSGAATYVVNLDRDDTYDITTRGSFLGRLRIYIDGQQVFDERNHLVWAGHGFFVAAVPLTAGSHRVELRYEKTWWAPGTGGYRTPNGNRLFAWSLGPMFFGRIPADSDVQKVPAAKASSLCGRPLDWVEVVAG